jgi:hypothetical protein
MKLRGIPGVGKIAAPVREPMAAKGVRTRADFVVRNNSMFGSAQTGSVPESSLRHPRHDFRP